MKKQSNLLQTGFSLIEVMVAVLVLAVGILAVSKLQGTLIKGGAEANNRTAAAQLVQRKAEDLRSFIYLTTTDKSPSLPNWTTTLSTPTSLVFNHIASNEGGLIDPGAITIGNVDYDLRWTVDDYYFSGTEAKATTTPVAGASHPDYKLIHIIAAWENTDGLTNTVSFDTVIHGYDPRFSAAGLTAESGAEPPVIPYDPLAAPDVLPIDLGNGILRETSKPLPELDKFGDNISVTFETVTYSTSTATLRREEFKTVACVCKGATSNDYHFTGITTWDQTLSNGEGGTVDDIEYAQYSVPKSEPDITNADNEGFLCTVCCRDNEQNSTDKICRLKRVDGILRYFKEPWKMVAFNIVPASYFDDTPQNITAEISAAMTTTVQKRNISNNSNYVTSLVRFLLGTVNSQAELVSYSTIDNNLSNLTSNFVNIEGITTIDHKVIGVTTAPLIARAVYMDYPPDGVFNNPTSSTNYTATNVPLDRIPFYEVNLTELVGWVPDEDDPDFTAVTEYTNNGSPGHDGGPSSTGSRKTTYANACSSASDNCVSNQELPENGSQYSRGRFWEHDSPGWNTTVYSRVYTRNAGIVDRPMITGINEASTDANLSITDE